MSGVLVVNSTNFIAYVFILFHAFQNDRGMDFSKRESMKEQLSAILEE